MNKRHLISTVAMLLALMLLGLSCGALAEENKCGTLSYLNLTEEEDSYVTALRTSMVRLLYIHGVLVSDDEWFRTEQPATLCHYDSLNALLMAFQSGEVRTIKVPYYTARYLCSTNDVMKITAEYHPEKASGISELALSLLSDGYSFLMKEENTALRDEFDAQITAIKEDGTLQKLIDEYIIKASEGEEPVAIAFEKFEGNPIKVAMTGSLPPMDYAAADGSFAGFNTAVLAEIGKRLQKNIELVQVDCVGRALALSEGTVDVVFWTRGMSESAEERRRTTGEGLEARLAEVRETMTDEEKAIFDEGEIPDQETRAKMRDRDMPEGTIITQPYFTDFPVIVRMK